MQFLPDSGPNFKGINPIYKSFELNFLLFDENSLLAQDVNKAIDSFSVFPNRDMANVSLDIQIKYF